MYSQFGEGNSLTFDLQNRTIILVNKQEHQDPLSVYGTGRSSVPIP